MDPFTNQQKTNFESECGKEWHAHAALKKDVVAQLIIAMTLSRNKALDNN